MDSDLVQILNLLRANGYSLVRQRKHAIYKNRDGRIWVTPITPSDTHAYKNNLAQFRKFLANGLVKQATRNLGITAFERRLADERLRPTAPRPRREAKPRRVVSKTPRPAATPLALAPTKKTKKEFYFDAYKFGAKVRKELDDSLGKAWPIVMVAVVEKWKAKTEKECKEKRDAGVCEQCITRHALTERNEAMKWYSAMRKAKPAIISGVTRLLQKAVNQEWPKEGEAVRLDAEIQKIFFRYFPRPANGGESQIKFNETSAWILKLLPKFTDNKNLPPGAVILDEADFTTGSRESNIPSSTQAIESIPPHSSPSPGR